MTEPDPAAEVPAIPSRYRPGPSPSAGYLAALRELDPDLPRALEYAWPPRRPLRENEQLAAMQELDAAIDKGRTRVALAGAPAVAAAVEALAQEALRAIVTGQPAILERADLAGYERALLAATEAELEYLRAFGAATVQTELRGQQASRRRAS